MVVVMAKKKTEAWFWWLLIGGGIGLILWSTKTARASTLPAAATTRKPKPSGPTVTMERFVRGSINGRENCYDTEQGRFVDMEFCEKAGLFL